MAAKGKILIIDDDPNFLEFIKIILESENYEVYTADNVNEGLVVMHQQKPGLLILDVMISYCFDGLDMTRKIRGDLELSKTPIIMVSAVVDKEDMAKALNGEFKYNCFMSKPISPCELVNVVGRILS